ncbi:hypothetical protein DYB28_011450, partial [Aphanomyces astaci]
MTLRITLMARLPQQSDERNGKNRTTVSAIPPSTAIKPAPEAEGASLSSVSAIRLEGGGMQHDGVRRICPHVAIDTRAGSGYVSNQIRTSKYTMWNFLPIGLYLAFRLSTNFYFLIIAVLQSMSVISPLGPMTAIFPLVLVVCISLLREAIEDRNRWLSDRKSNLKPTRVWRQGQVLDVVWEHIQVGDVLLVRDKETFAADGIVLSSSDENGACLIDTSNLDGEANLKPRNCHETKMMKNAKEAHHKLSHVDGILNRAVVFIFVVQVTLCAVGSVCHKLWAAPFESAIMDKQAGVESVSGVLTFLSFVVLLNT